MKRFLTSQQIKSKINRLQVEKNIKKEDLITRKATINYELSCLEENLTNENIDKIELLQLEKIRIEDDLYNLYNKFNIL